MTQVRPEYLRWVETWFWNTASHTNQPEPELRSLPQSQHQRARFRFNLLEELKKLPFDRFIALRNQARIWLFSLSSSEQEKLLREYDELKLVRLPAPKRINWQEQLDRLV